MTRRALVTGGSGFLGRHVIPILVDRGYEIVALARSAEAASAVRDLGAEPLAADLDDPASVDRAFADAKADVLVNLASLGFGQAPTIVAAAGEAGITRGVFVSSTAIFTTIDAPSKPRRRAGEDVVTTSPLAWTVVRPTMIYGAPGDRNLARLLGVLRRAPVLPLPGGGARLQQPVHVDDLALAIVTALDRPNTIHKAYNLAGPEALTFRQLLEQAGDAVGRRPLLVPIPLRPTIAAMRLYEGLVPAPRLKAEQLERLAEDKAFDISDAQRDLDFAPRPFRVGVAEEASMLAAGSPDAADTEEHFTEVAATWVRRYAERPSFRHRLRVVGRVLAETEVGDRPVVLDFGGGPGVFSVVASATADRVVLLDVSEAMVRAGADRVDDVVDVVGIVGSADSAPPRPEVIRRVVGPIETLHASEKGSFDVCLAIAVLEYLPDPAKTVATLCSLLRPGGRLILTVPNDRSAFRRVESLVGSLGASLGRVLGSERLRSRAYASVRPHGNHVPWQKGIDHTRVAVERIVPLTLADDGALSHFAATQIIVVRKHS